VAIGIWSWIFKILTPSQVHVPNMHYRAKFCQNQSHGCGDMAIFRFFFVKMAAVRHLGFVWCILIETTHKGYLKVSIIGQILVAIHLVVFII